MRAAENKTIEVIRLFPLKLLLPQNLVRMSGTIKVFAPSLRCQCGGGFWYFGLRPREARWWNHCKAGDRARLKNHLHYRGQKQTSAGSHAKIPLAMLLFVCSSIWEEKGPSSRWKFTKMPFGSGLDSSAASAVGGVFAVNEWLKTGLTKSRNPAFCSWRRTNSWWCFSRR